jgi:branched-chain amino acid transport system substrate-binding protein
VVAVWEKDSGQKITLYDNSLAPTSDPTSYILKAKEAGCQADVLLGNSVLLPPWMNDVLAQKATEIKWMWPAPAFIPTLPTLLGSKLNGLVYTDPELNPEESNAKVKEVYAAVKAHGGKLQDNILEGGWLAGEVITHAIQSVKGEVTRTAVTEALKQLTSFPNPFTGEPYAFGPGSKHLSNQTVKEAVTENGKWKIITPEWIKVAGMTEI